MENRYIESGYIDKINKILNKPIIPVPSQEECFKEMIAFPDKDATEEEIADYLKNRQI